MKQLRIDFLHTPEYDWVTPLPTPFAGMVRAVCLVQHGLTTGVIGNVAVSLGSHYKMFLLDVVNEIVDECRKAHVTSNIIPVPEQYWLQSIPVRYKQISRLLYLIKEYIAEKKIDDFEVLLPSTTVTMSEIASSLLGNFPKSN